MRSVCMCNFCSYIDAEENVKEHEKHCLKNPNVKNCFNCAYVREIPVVQAWGWGTNGSKSTFCCTYIEKIEKDDVNLYVKKHCRANISANTINAAHREKLYMHKL